ncbi:hypothetical protein V6N13_119355 [Hibiscus sabdariffa]|uniref:Uncharacterized protein n=1 Tax=Hibiscus sabdariffa TaxID=183260 RepID=A0ABR2E0Y9_9ROSI
MKAEKRRLLYLRINNKEEEKEKEKKQSYHQASGNESVKIFGKREKRKVIGGKKGSWGLGLGYDLKEVEELGPRSDPHVGGLEKLNR